MALLRRMIRVTFALGTGAFGESGTDTVALPPLRTSAKIIKAGTPSMVTAQLAIYGMTLSQMNKLSTLGLAPTLIRRNTVTVEAGDEQDGVSTVFIGTVINAWSDFQGAPEVPFRVEAASGLFEAVSTAPPSTFPGSASVEVILSGLAARMKLGFENNGVTTVLSNPYFFGSPRNQAYACAEAAGIEINIDNRVMAIWPRGGARGGAVPLISPQTGMIGYPSFTSKGIAARTLFNRSVSFGGNIKVVSDLTPACGTWTVYKLNHDLESQVPKGAWFSDIEAARPGLGPVLG